MKVTIFHKNRIFSILLTAIPYFEGVCVNYRNPDPRRGEPRVGSAPDVAFPVDPLLGSAELREAQKLLVFTCFSAHLAGIGDFFLALTIKNIPLYPFFTKKIIF